jgi:hypothetical protein
LPKRSMCEQYLILPSPRPEVIAGVCPEGELELERVVFEPILVAE